MPPRGLLTLVVLSPAVSSSDSSLSSASFCDAAAACRSLALSLGFFLSARRGSWCLWASDLSVRRVGLRRLPGGLLGGWLRRLLGAAQRQRRAVFE